MLHIHYDGLIYMLQAAGGVNRYFSNIIRRLPADVFPVLTTYQVRAASLPEHENLQVINYKRFAPGLLCSALRPIYFRAVNQRKKYDVAHPTYYSLLTGRGLEQYRCPVVVTVYDLILEKFKENLDPTGANSAAKRKAIMAAQVVICISESTKRDLLEIYGIPESKVVVTHLASDLTPGPSDGAEPVPDRPYFLFVGGRAGYKNFAALLQSFARLAAHRPETMLCVVGPPFDAAEQAAIGSLRLEGSVQHHGYATDAQLAALYRHSVAFVYPSLYEGFGIPPLEAMACGAPVIACNTSSIPEVVGEAALLFDPTSAEELTHMLSVLLEDNSERERLIALGYQRSRMFNWDKTAAQTLDVYRALAT